MKMACQQSPTDQDCWSRSTEPRADEIAPSVTFFFSGVLAIIKTQLHWWFLCGNSPVKGIGRRA